PACGGHADRPCGEGEHRLRQRSLFAGARQGEDAQQHRFPGDAEDAGLVASAHRRRPWRRRRSRRSRGARRDGVTVERSCKTAGASFDKLRCYGTTSGQGIRVRRQPKPFPLEDDMSESPTRDTPAAPGEDATIYLALELSKARWQVGLVVPGSVK